MSQMIRKAVKDDVSSIVRIYDAILDREEEAEEKLIGWVRGIYPTEQTAEDALRKGTLFVYEENGEIVAAAKIDQEQVCEYADCHWEFDAPDNEIMVMHTLVVDPQCSKKGYGKSFLDFYEAVSYTHLSVITAHYLRVGGSFQLSSFDGTVYITAFSFIMQGFLFFSGYFSKNLQKCRDGAVKNFLLPYIIMMPLMFISRYILSGNAELNFFKPSFALWFMLVMFVYRFFLKSIYKIPYIVHISVFLMLISGSVSYTHLARSLAASPEILLMDEPFGSVDEITRGMLQDEIIRIHEQTGITILFVTHDINEAMRLGTKVLVMDRGCVKQYDSPDAVRKNPADEFVEKLLFRSVE